MWWMIAAAAVQAYQANEANDKAKSLNSLIDAKTGARAVVRRAENGRAMAEDSLKRWVQSVNNKAVLRAGGAALGANTTNQIRAQEGLTSSKFTTNLKDIEQEGQRLAFTAASGVSGSAVDMVAGSMALRASIVKENIRRVGVSEASDSALQAGMIYSQMINGMDNSILNPGIDYNVDTPQHAEVKSNFDLFAPIVAEAALSGMKSGDISMGSKPSSVPTTSSAAFKFSDQVTGNDYFSLDYSTPTRSSQGFGRSDPWRY